MVHKINNKEYSETNQILIGSINNTLFGFETYCVKYDNNYYIISCYQGVICGIKQSKKTKIFSEANIIQNNAIELFKNNTFNLEKEKINIMFENKKYYIWNYKTIFGLTNKNPDKVTTSTVFFSSEEKAKSFEKYL